MVDILSLKSLVQQVRRDILRMVHKVNSGHPGGSLGCAEFLVVLYNEVMDHNSDFNMHGKNEDLFFLSNGHISPVLYSVLARNGYFPIQELNTFRHINSRLQGHPTTHDDLPGIRIASGSLGQGLSVAIGAALSKKINKDPKTIFVLMGDGELQEGQNWEALMFAAAKKVDNIIVTVDLNGKQIDGTTKDVLDLGDVKSKFNSFGWKTLELNEGNNIEFIISKIAEAKNNLGKGIPIAILMKTEMGNGVDFMMNTHAWHGKAPNDDQLKIALSQNPITLGDY
ncbi:MAG: transketolase [Flavobacteriaceae bacterium]|jgi:transketolase|nr:transketolase [Flavobacteriaceae bacterium]MAH82169.1 transketolase [Flavobacteriaceae bacterium]MBQ22374.1 transketolase [Flavobacteriales bacterium]|tara:strand:+ start:775 stop:1620 length:846 start_codon:yes stop_codon:yes gene_type:complete